MIIPSLTLIKPLNGHWIFVWTPFMLWIGITLYQIMTILFVIVISLLINSPFLIHWKEVGRESFDFLSNIADVICAQHLVTTKPKIKLTCILRLLPEWSPSLSLVEETKPMNHNFSTCIDTAWKLFYPAWVLLLDSSRISSSVNPTVSLSQIWVKSLS